MLTAYFMLHLLMCRDGYDASGYGVDGYDKSGYNRYV